MLLSPYVSVGLRITDLITDLSNGFPFLSLILFSPDIEMGLLDCNKLRFTLLQVRIPEKILLSRRVNSRYSICYSFNKEVSLGLFLYRFFSGGIPVF